jgi:hypothetical protein
MIINVKRSLKFIIYTAFLCLVYAAAFGLTRTNAETRALLYGSALLCEFYRCERRTRAARKQLNWLSDALAGEYTGDCIGKRGRRFRARRSRLEADEILEKSREVLARTDEGFELDPSDMDLLDKARDDFLDEAGCAAFEALYERVAAGQYVRPWLQGVAPLTYDLFGDV